VAGARSPPEVERARELDELVQRLVLDHVDEPGVAQNATWLCGDVDVRIMPRSVQLEP
jgi:hypothetical protein